MIQIKKTILTLVALLAVTTGAWADETPLLTIESKDYTSFKSGSMTFDDMVTVTFSNSVYNYGNGDGWNAGAASLLTVAGTNGYAVTSCKFYTENGPAMTGYTVEGESPSVYLYNSAVYTDASKSVYKGYAGITKIEVYGTAPSAASGPEVAWDKATKTGTFTMPGGNVTLEPEYYPQAALTTAPTAINDVPATTDGAIVKAGTVATIGETTAAQGTVMYYVSPTALDDAALLALAADQWTADVPTAEKLTKGEAYVYYYVRGNDSDTDEENFSDGDILSANALQVTLGAAPLWNAEFDLTDAPEADKTGKWSTNIPEGGVTKGQTVTVTYTGSKKVIGVKAEKKAAAPASTPLDNTTTAWSAGTFAVPAGGLTYSDAITVSGDVTLTLTDGETLTLNKGISLASGATLTIQGNGTMNVNGTNNSTASTVAGTGMLVLTSGTLNAKGGNGESFDQKDDYNGRSGGTAINGSVTVSGGTLTAIGGNGGDVWFSGDWDNSYGGSGGTAITGSVTINSGTLTATGGKGGNLNCAEDCSNLKAGNGGDAIGGSVTENGGTTTFANGSNGSASTGPDCSNCNAGSGGKAVAGNVTDNR